MSNDDNIHQPPSERQAGINLLIDQIGWWAEHGYPNQFVLLSKNQKVPSQSSWPDLQVSAAIATKYAENGNNVGLRLNGLLVLDADCKNGRKGLQSRAKLDLLPTRMTSTPSGGTHEFFVTPDHFTIKTTSKAYPGIDFKAGPGHQVLLPGCQFEGKFYGLEHDTELQFVPHQLPGIQPLKTETTKAVLDDDLSIAIDEQSVKDILKHRPSRDMTYEEWLETGMCLSRIFNGADNGLHLWDLWSSRSEDERYKGVEDLEVKWSTFTRNDEGVGFPRLRELCSAADGKPQTVTGMLQRIDQFIARDIEPVSYLIEQFLPSTFMAMVYAKRGVGKTWFSYWLANSLLTNQEFLTWKVTSSIGNILLVDSELPTQLLHERLKAMIDPAAASRMFLFSTLDFMTVNNAPFNLYSTDHQQILERWIEEADIKLVIIDNRSSSFLGGEQNEAEPAEQPLMWMAMLRNRGISSLMVHHAGKTGAQRGSSRWEDPLDLTIQLDEVLIDKRIIPSQFLVRLEKVRYQRPLNDVMKVQVVTFDERTTLEALGEVPRELLQEQIDLLRYVNQGLKTKEIVERTGKVKRTVQRQLTDLSPKYLSKDVDIATKGGRGLFPFTLTEEGLRVLQIVAFGDNVEEE